MHYHLSTQHNMCHNHGFMQPIFASHTFLVDVWSMLTHTNQLRCVLGFIIKYKHNLQKRDTSIDPFSGKIYDFKDVLLLYFVNHPVIFIPSFTHSND